MRRPRSLENFGKEIYRTYIVDQPNHFAASLSYYALFSLVPIIYVATFFAGLFIDSEAATQRILTEVGTMLGVDVANLLLYMLDRISLQPSESGIVGWMVSFISMLLGASLLFFKLQYTLNTIWRVPPSPKNQTKALLLNRIFALLMVVSVGILLVIITLSNLFINFAESLFQSGISLPFLNVGTTSIISIASIALLFRVLPDARIKWRDALIGASVTALLLSAGVKGLGWYVSNWKVGSPFEAAGSVAVLLIAIYLMAQFFIFGAVFTRVFAEHYGGGLQPRQAVMP
jgi:membrane protein